MAKAFVPSLEVKIRAPASFTLSAGAPLLLETAVTRPDAACLDVAGAPGAAAAAPPAVSYAWSIVGDAPAQLSEDAAAAPTLSLPAAVLRAGAAYRVAVIASAGGASTSAFVDVVVDAPPLAVEGCVGEARAAAVDAPVTLKAEPYDPANALDASGEPHAFVFEWACGVDAAVGAGGAPCFEEGSAGASALLEGGAEVTVPAGAMTAGRERGRRRW